MILLHCAQCRLRCSRKTVVSVTRKRAHVRTDQNVFTSSEATGASGAASGAHASTRTCQAPISWLSVTIKATHRIARSDARRMPAPPTRSIIELASIPLFRTVRCRSRAYLIYIAPAVRCIYKCKYFLLLYNLRFKTVIDRSSCWTTLIAALARAQLSPRSAPTDRKHRRKCRPR